MEIQMRDRNLFQACSDPAKLNTSVELPACFTQSQRSGLLPRAETSRRSCHPQVTERHGYEFGTKKSLSAWRANILETWDGVSDTDTRSLSEWWAGEVHFPIFGAEDELDKVFGKIPPANNHAPGQC